MATGSRANADSGQIEALQNPTLGPAFWTAVPARRNHKTKGNRPLRSQVARQESSQTARDRATSQRARDVWAPRLRHPPAVTRCEPSMNPGHESLHATYRPARWIGRPTPGRPMPLAGCERLIADVGFNVLDLDELIGLASRQITKTAFSHGPSSLKPLIHHSEGYFPHVPARYGNCTCLDDALRCVATKVKHVISPESYGSPSGETDLYGKALRSLQSAIASDAWTDPSVLCAAELISIYELLQGPSRSTSWALHISGCSRLIRARGPRGFHTEFERSLLISMLGSLIQEGLTSNEMCFLAEPAWQVLLQEMLLPASGLSLRSRSYVWLGVLGARATGLMREVQDALLHREALSVDDIKTLQSRCRAQKADSTKWRIEHDAYHAGAAQLEGPLTKKDGWAELLSAGCSLQAMSCRLVGAVSYEDRVAEEYEALRHAETMMGALRDTTAHFNVDVCGSGTAQFYVDQKGGVATRVLATTDIWLAGCDSVDDAKALSLHEGLIDAWAYQAWSDYKPQ